MRSDTELWLMIYIGAFVAFIGLVFVYEMIRPTYFWLAAKVLGWSHHEQFMREIVG